MRKLRIGLILLLIILCPFPLPAEVQQPLSLQIASCVPGLAYEPAYQTGWFIANLSVLFKINYSHWSLGLQSDIDYLSYSSLDGSNNLDGARFDLRALLIAELECLNWLKVRLGLGGLWLRSSLNYEHTGWYGGNQGGLASSANILFKLPLSFLDLEWGNKFDLLFVDPNIETFSGLDLYYKSGLKTTFYPGMVSWLAVFACLDLVHWQTTSAAIRPNLWILNANIGIDVKFDLAAARKPEPKPTLPPSVDTTTITKTTDGTRNDANPANTTTKGKSAQDYEKIKPALRSLYEARQGDKINFSDIIFKESLVILLPASLEILDNIVEILTAKPGLTVSISGYAEYYKDPVKEITLATGRANYIRQYLIDKGIDKNRIKISPVTQLSVKHNQPSVIISVLTEK